MLQPLIISWDIIAEFNFKLDYLENAFVIEWLGFNLEAEELKMLLWAKSAPCSEA